MSFLHNKFKTIMRLLLLIMILGLAWRGYYFKKSFARTSLKTDATVDFKLVDVTLASGIEFTHQHEKNTQVSLKNVEPWLSSQGSSVAVVDVNNDEYPDVYLTTTKFNEKNKLFINQKNGSFVDEAKKYGLDDINAGAVTFRALFFDCDNDGQQEVLILTESCPRLYKKNAISLKYERIAFSKGAEACVTSVSANIFDYNKDGLLDIIYAGATGNSFSGSDNLPMGFVSATNGAGTFAFKNKGQCQFEKVNLLDRQKENLFTNAIGVGDFRGTNSADIWFATDFNTDRIYTKKDSDQYVYSNDMIDHYLAKSGMSVEHTYLNDDEKPYIFVSHTYKKGFNPYGNNFWHFENNKFHDSAPGKGLLDCGWAWGAKFADMNNDGYSDLYVANGFLTSESVKTEKDYWYFLGVVSAGPRSLVIKADKWPDMSKFNLSGFERDCFFINNKENQFVDASEYFDIDKEKLNGRGVASLDINNNGSMGLIVTNQKNKAYVYQSVQKNQNDWIGFKLIGQKSNRDAIGAKVKVYLQSEGLGPFLTQEVAPYNGYVSQSDSRLHFGIGKSKSKDIHIEIIWPSGKIEQISGLAINTYHKITEGQ